jgi:hypothetical protein
MRVSKKLTLKIGAVAAAALAGTVAFSGQAFASGGLNVRSGTYRIIRITDGHCLDSNYQGQVYVLPCNGGNYQNWQLTNYNDGTDGVHTDISLRNAQTGMCLDGNGSSLYTHACGGSYQDWNTNGLILGQEAFNGTKCMASGGTSVFYESCSGVLNESWGTN